MRRTTGAPNSANGNSSGSSGSSAARAPMSFAPAAASRPAAAIDPFAARSRVAPSAAASSAARSAASPAAGIPARPARVPSVAAAVAAPAADDPDMDLDGLLAWDARRASERARDERALRDRILARDREMRADRQRVQRLAGASSELSDMLAAMLARSSIGGGGFGDEAGPALDPLTGLPQSMCVTLRCFSFAVADRPQLQGDKIILPGEALYQINRLRLPFPLLFRIEKMGADGEERRRGHAAHASVGAAGAGAAASSSSSSSSQYAGVLEFSAPAEQCFLPQWMMENLRVGEGDSVRVYSESHVPQARWVKLQPHSQSFSALLRELGPKYFLENAMRHYSVLTKGQRIMVSHAGQNHSLDVVDARPNDTVSLLGNLDLEVEFGPALDAPRDERDGANTFRAHASGPAAAAADGAADPDDEDEQLKRALAMSLAESGLSSEPPVAAEPMQADASPVADDEGWAVAAPPAASAQPSGVSSLQARFGSGNRLGGATVSGVPEAKYAEPAVVQPVPAPAPAAAAALPESKEDQEDESDDDDGSDAEHEAPHVAAAEVPPNHLMCPTCNRAIATSSFSLHTLHCARAFTKCSICARMVKKAEAESHAASHARVECGQCHVQLEARKLKRHLKRDCAYRPSACKWCGDATPLIKLPSHEAACGSLTQVCAVCEQPIPRRDMRDHPTSEACRVQCAKCEEVIISRDIVAHTKDRCSGRMLECPYCHLSFAARETPKHEEYCGSRTESCDQCQRYIKLRDMARHADSKCAFPAVEARPAPAAAARASPPLGAQSASAAARINLLSSMLEGGANVDPAVMAALLAQSVELEDPLAAAAARNAGPSLSSASTSIAARQAAAARAKQRRELLDSDDSDVEEYMQRGVPRSLRGAAASASSVSASASASAPANQPQPAAAVRSASSQRAPSPSVARAAAGGSFRCAYCSDTCASLENLQVHILTECSEAHARMESADPAAAAKALAGQSIREHVTVKIPVAKPVSRAQGPLSSGASASASAAFSAPASSPLAAAAAFDPYDLSWKRPHRQASEELRRHIGARQSSQRDSNSDSDDEVRELSAAEVRAAKAASTAAASGVPARPKLMTSNTKLRQHVPLHSATGAASSNLRPSSFYDDDGDGDDATRARVSSLHAGAGSGSGSMRSSARAPFSTTPSSSLKQQQRDLEKAISARKAATAASAAAAASRPAPRGFAASSLDDDEATHAPAPRSSASVHQPSPVPRRSSGSAATGFSARTSGVSPSFMGGLGVDVPIRSTSSSSSSSSGSTKKGSSGSGGLSSGLSSSKAQTAVDDYERWLSSSRPGMAHSNGATRPNPAAPPARTANTTATTSRPARASSPFSSARGAGAGLNADPSPLASYLARGGSGSGSGSSSSSSSGLGAESGPGSSSFRYSSYEPLSFGASPSVTSASAAAASMYAHGASPSQSSRERPSFDRPLSGTRAPPSSSGPAASHSSAPYSSSGYSAARPSSPPSNQKAVRSSASVRAAGASQGAYGHAGTPSASAYEQHPASRSVSNSQTASRARAPSATRTPVAVSPHVPLYGNGVATPASAAHARRSGSIGRTTGSSSSTSSSSSRPTRG